jgi:hypothetical protein
MVMAPIPVFLEHRHEAPFERRYIHHGNVRLVAILIAAVILIGDTGPPL